ncbi:AAC(3) family N-acetyltransferase [Microbulbifer yueqingensis]|uniref:Aminoglycoside N(3)-acetyltransferase n=1 Tax=Microbulbifer yueqingensis TaxID=658219 RepID=A0A1G8VKX3_9GAMM|nr:AAC(3) family N-acetyltransferase [Microbulbifer yueqingensis]SDJ66731.1 Aminoglycoside 3-N-acetyltransferase [Microbulbifer yueqingensis]
MRKIIKQMKPYFPRFLRDRIDKERINLKIKAARKRKERVFVSWEEWQSVLQRFKLDSDLLVHSSMSNIGKIEGGAVAVTGFLLENSQKNRCTLLAPALPFTGMASDYLESLREFDLASARNCMGAVSNLVLKNEHCVRSLHPSHSVVAVGQDSSLYVEEHYKGKTPFDQCSPYRKLVERGGKILMFGVGLNSVTNFHVYEDMILDFLPFKVYSDKVFRIRCKSDLLDVAVETRAHNLRLSSRRDCEISRTFLIDSGAIETYRLGDSEVSLLDARRMTHTLLSMLLQGHSIYGRVRLDSKQEEGVRNALSFFQ